MNKIALVGALAVALAFAGTASASLLEDLGLYQQNDGGSGMDAEEDVCEPTEPSIELDATESKEGEMLFLDDEEDTWSLTIPAANVGDTIEVFLVPNPDNALTQQVLFFPIHMRVFDPGCETMVAEGDTGPCDPFSAVFEAEEAGIYTLEITLRTEEPHFPILGTLTGASTAREHCSLYCLSDYALFAKSTSNSNLVG